MADEYFYGVTLGEAGASVTWHPVGNTDEYPNPNYKLSIKQFLLGHTAKEGEYNVVEVETLSLRDPIKIPVAVLKVGESRTVLTSLEFPDAPVTFKLIEGSGPVHIHGQQLPGSYEVEDIEELEEIEEELLDEEEGEDDDEDDGQARKKRKLSNNSKPIKGNPPNSNNKNNKKK